VGLTRWSVLVLLAAQINVACNTSRESIATKVTRSSSLNYLAALSGDYFEQFSNETGRRYQIFVRLPENYAKPPPGVRYPVVYVLDGDSLFPMIAPEHLFLTYDEGLPEAIVVGIAYGSFDPSINRRDVDFTAPADGVGPEKAGAPAFQRFLKSELAPVIERKYRADPDRRILFGQSRGGAFVLYSAFTDPDLFWGRIASNPSFGSDGDRLFGDAPVATRHDLGLVVTSGSRDRPQLRADALKWFQRWDKAAEAPWRIKTVTIEGGTHAADCANAYRAGMLWLFARTGASPNR
jgi:predicted alpha/beta superfamily hydrolase